MKNVEADLTPPSTSWTGFFCITLAETHACRDRHSQYRHVTADATSLSQENADLRIQELHAAERDRKDMHARTCFVSLSNGRKTTNKKMIQSQEIDNICSKTQC